jgi:2-polyprenyl-3-methyl-5-hydroxy-6-metoxy-1,4-benzoquinol methylase
MSLEYYAESRPEMKQFLPTSASRILEIGCGNANFSEMAGPYSEYWGVEPNPEAARTAAAKITRVLNGTFEECVDQLPDSHFDLVVCNDVIEHMVDHVAFLDLVKRKLAPGGKIIGSIPNVRYYKLLLSLIIHREWRYTDWGVLDRTHLRFFTRRSLERTFSEQGYVCERMRMINRSAIPISIKGLVHRMFITLVGRDSRYLQMGWRVSLPTPSEPSRTGRLDGADRVAQ